MIAFGERLRETRKAKGLSLEAVVDATRIPRRHLEALERSDLGSLPAGPFAKGYIEAYADVLGVDARPILDGWRLEARRLHLDATEARDRTIEEFSQIVEQRAGAARRPRRIPLGWKGITLGLAAAGLVAIAGSLLVRSRTPRAPDASASPAPTTPVPLPPENAPLAPAPGKGPAPGTPPDTSPTSAPSTATAPTPEARPARVPPRPNPDLRIPEYGVGEDVRSHRLVGRGEEFVAGSGVVFWTLVLGGQPGDAIRHVWFHEGRAAMRADLEIGGSHWRTYSRLALPRGATGSWTVEARDPGGRLLARQEFRCVPAVR